MHYFIQCARWHCMQDEISFSAPRKVQPCATAVGSLRVRESMSMEVRLPINRLRPRPDMVWQRRRHRRIDEVFLHCGPFAPLRVRGCHFTLGPYLNDVRKIFRFLDPLPPCNCPIHATYQYYRHVLANPLSSQVHDIVYGWSLGRR